MILSVLKVIGIILLVMMILIIFIVGIILFVPIRYWFEGAYNEVPYGDVFIKWSPVLFKASFSFHDNQFVYVVKLLGGVIMTNTEAEISWIGRKFFSFDGDDMEEDFEEADIALSKRKVQRKENNSSEDKEISQKKEESGIHSDPAIKSDNASYDIEAENHQENRNRKRQSDSILDKICKKIAAWKKGWQDFTKKLKEISDKKDALLKVYHSKRFDLAKRDAILYIKEIFRIIKPDKLEGYIRFGMDDPAVTGQVLGLLAIVFVFYQEFLTIQPDFTQSCLEGNMKGKGKIIVFPVVKLIIKVILNKNLIKVTKKVQTIIEA